MQRFRNDSNELILVNGSDVDIRELDIAEISNSCDYKIKDLSLKMN